MRREECNLVGVREVTGIRRSEYPGGWWCVLEREVTGIKDKRVRRRGVSRWRCVLRDRDREVARLVPGRENRVERANKEARV